MTLLKDYFYHKTIHAYTNLFGSLFAELKVKNGNKTIAVPIAYANVQKFNTLNVENPDKNVERSAKLKLPRMSFKLNGFEKNMEDIHGGRAAMLSHVLDAPTDVEANTQTNSVPYIFKYQLDIKTKNLDEMFQLLEQICPVFNPTISITFEDNTDLGHKRDVRVTMTSGPSMIDEINDSPETARIIETTLEFDLAGALFMPTNRSKIIKNITLNYSDMQTGEFLGNDEINADV